MDKDLKTEKRKINLITKRCSQVGWNSIYDFFAKIPNDEFSVWKCERCNELCKDGDLHKLTPIFIKRLLFLFLHKLSALFIKRLTFSLFQPYQQDFNVWGPSEMGQHWGRRGLSHYHQYDHHCRHHHRQHQHPHHHHPDHETQGTWASWDHPGTTSRARLRFCRWVREASYCQVCWASLYQPKKSSRWPLYLLWALYVGNLGFSNISTK